jgi:nitrilase
MPLLRHSLYSQNVNLYLAPTADARDTWLPLMRTIACEGRAVVLSSNQCVRRKDLPAWVRGTNAPGASNGVMAVGEAQEMDPQPPKSQRRRSTVTKTEDNHEITWPATSPISAESPLKPSAIGIGSPTKPTASAVSSDDGNDYEESPVHPPPTRSKSITTKTADNHEITWPTTRSPTKPGLHHAHSYSSYHHKPPTTFTVPATFTEDVDLLYGNNSPGEEYVCRGGSCIVGPAGEVLAGPLFEAEGGLLVADVDFEDCERGRLDLDVAGSYSRCVLLGGGWIAMIANAIGLFRNDSFKLTVEGLDLTPPP